jgi:glyoxylase-like metal-dependent hydrolase (beta-lactamase superfamily II)
MKLSIIDTGFFKLDGGAMFGVVPKVMWNNINPADDKNLCTWAMRCMLVETEDRKILIDTGLGDKQSDKFFSYYEPHGDESLMSSIDAQGIAAGDITDVFMTHLHFDHCGGSVEKDGEELIPAFPNAKFWSNKTHWDWAVDPNPRERASFLKENIVPLQDHGVLEFVNEDHLTELVPGFNIRFVSGHTEKMMLPQIKVGDKTIVYMADLIPSAGHVPLPYIMAYDMQPLLTLEEKKSFLNEAVEEGYILFFEHDKAEQCCTLEMQHGRVGVAKTMTLEEALNS